MNLPEQYVTALTKRNALTVAALGVFCLVFMAFCWLAEIPLPTLIWLCLWLLSSVSLLLAAGKYFEPDYSLKITPETIDYVHRKGTWRLHWDNIVRFDIPRVQRPFALEDLPYIAFRVDNIDRALADISPRLANHLVFEQRQLLIMALRHQLPDAHDYSDYFDIPERYISPNGQQYRGVMAVFATRTAQLRELLGYDFYISANALDRDLFEFRDYLRQLQQSKNQYLS
ncbi:hypothetical protein A10D4_02940 [Idiomarina xiamenensis 10-D-4]|uniref:DUF2982 domain-containing protein n=2 Tax=Idiomarina xiamenensis TaxID=1207041 RepID=K2JP52_9GAMM|nr:hypothetical protein A10D4_02940 [Idiomarina xiamenensis 10-D-4]